MSKQELINVIADAGGLPKTTAESVLNAFTDYLITTVENGGKVTVPGLGILEPSHRAARTGRDPKSGQPMQIPAKTVPKFKAAKKFKDAVNKQSKRD